MRMLLARSVMGIDTLRDLGYLSTDAPMVMRNTVFELMLQFFDRSLTEKDHGKAEQFLECAEKINRA